MERVVMRCIGRKNQLHAEFSMAGQTEAFHAAPALRENPFDVGQASLSASTLPRELAETINFWSELNMAESGGEPQHEHTFGDKPFTHRPTRQQKGRHDRPTRFFFPRPRG
jgi:hypothetical protein